MKKTAVWLAVATVVAALPFGVVWLVQGDSGMAAVMLLFYLADPVFSLILGTAAGREIKKLWFLPLCFPFLFLLGVGAAFTFKEWIFYAYGAGYLILGYLATGVTWLIGRKKG